jgi:hypothetical protein
MKEVILAMLMMLPKVTNATDGKNIHSSSRSSQSKLIITETIELKEGDKTKKVEIKRKIDVPVKKVETKDSNGHKVILYIPDIQAR